MKEMEETAFQRVLRLESEGAQKTGWRTVTRQGEYLIRMCSKVSEKDSHKVAVKLWMLDHDTNRQPRKGEAWLMCTRVEAMPRIPNVDKLVLLMLRSWQARTALIITQHLYLTREVIIAWKEDTQYGRLKIF